MKYCETMSMRRLSMLDVDYRAVDLKVTDARDAQTFADHIEHANTLREYQCFVPFLLQSV